MIQSARIQMMKDGAGENGQYVLYWMQQAQRVRYNHALTYAIEEANTRNLPVVVVFGVTDDYPEANERHYAFMLEGLRDVSIALKKKKIQFVLQHQSPDEAALSLAKDAAFLVMDRGYLKIQKLWRSRVVKEVSCGVVQVETDVVVPVDVVTNKEEYAARTIRPKIHRILEDYLMPVDEIAVKKSSLKMIFEGLDVSDVDGVLAKMKIDRSVGRVDTFVGGEKAAQKMLKAFLELRLDGYSVKRNDPNLNGVSHMSPYLHFGQISPLDILLQMQDVAGETEDTEVYLEELVVRRELSMNFVNQNPNYDRYDALPEWAKKTLAKHEDDVRDYVYDLEVWEAAETHDPYWNAAQMEMLKTGKMHNYMRMYWGKKVIEWSETPQQAFETILYLNNRYELDGRDANSFTGVAWCFGKHDRPWKERPVFGMVRYMNAKGLQRKFDVDGYVVKVGKL
jgi:deoxyribodipyrimidine photo-lyase